MLLALARLLSVVLALEDGKVDSEIAWARATWPELASVNFRSPVLKVVYAWIDVGGPLEVTVYTSGHDCMRAQLARDDGGTLMATVRYPPDWYIPDWVEELEVAEELTLQQPWEAYMYGTRAKQMRPRYGVLTYADARVARFGGKAINQWDLPRRDWTVERRLTALLERVVAWRPSSAPLSQIAALYRNPDDCRREHPAPARGTER